MLFGAYVDPRFVAVAGMVLLVLLLFQVSLGMRWIKIKGRRHWTVHKSIAFTILALGVLHAVVGLVVTGVLRLG